MKKLFVLTMVVALLVVTVVPAFAAGGPQTGNGNSGGGGSGKGVNAPFALAGTIAGLDPAVRTVTVTVACGNKLVKPFIGQDMTIQTTDATRFLLRNPDGTVTPITFDDLAVGQKVSSHGQFVNQAWIASRITVGADLNCLP